jgi:hypothetical protein
LEERFKTIIGISLGLILALSFSYSLSFISNNFQKENYDMVLSEKSQAPTIGDGSNQDIRQHEQIQVINISNPYIFFIPVAMAFIIALTFFGIVKYSQERSKYLR